MATYTLQAAVEFRQYGIFNSDGELTRLTDIPSSAQITIPKGTGVLLVEGGQNGDNPPGSYQSFWFRFASSQASSWTTRLLCCLVNGSVAVGTSVDRIKEVAIKKDVQPTAISSGSFYDVTFKDLGIPFKHTYSSTPISIYIENPSIQNLTITINGPNTAYIVTQGDDTAPTYNVTGPIGQTFEFGDTVNLLWTRGSMPSNSPEITTWIEYSKDNGENWTTLTRGTGMPTGYSVNAGSFGVGAVLWRVRGITYFSDWGTPSGGNFTVKPPLSVATPTSPRSGEYRSEKSEITLEWKASNPGTLYSPDKTDIQWKTENGQWTDLATITDGGRSYPVPANTFPHEVIYWRVRAYNQDDLPGNWSEAINFTTIDAPITATPTSPISGAKRDETTAILFAWNIYNNFGNSPTGADLEWNLGGGAWQTLGHVDGSSKQFTAPANTFPAGTIWWRVRAYNQDGVASNWSGEAYFSTIDAPSVSTPISPSGTIEDTDSDLLFRWSTSSTSGSTPTGADLQYSYDGITWLVLGHTDGTTQLTVSGGRIHAGTVQWQVRSYNRNGTPGAWSASASFVAHAAPRILDLITDGKPFTTFTWQATDQREYHIVIDDDLVIGPVFDEVKTYQLTDYLEDGLHTVKIRVQNEMSVWSEWAETQFQVLNIPDGEIELQGSWDIDADLFWEDQTTDAEYMVYRDGGLIGKTHSKAFADRVVLGEHRYHVIRRLSDGCYSISNTVSGSMSTRLTRVAPLVGGEWLALVKSENAKRSERFTRRRKVAYHHFSGNKFPTPEIGDQEELIGEYDAAWMHTEEGAKILDSLVGQAIIVKSRSGKVIIGVLEGYTSGEKKHFSGFTFDLKQMDWEDYVCDI